MFPLFGVPHLVLFDGLRKKAWECWAWKKLTEWVTWSWISRSFPGISKLRGRALIIPLFQIRGKETSVRWGWQVTFGKGLAHDWLLPLGGHLPFLQALSQADQCQVQGPSVTQGLSTPQFSRLTLLSLETPLPSFLPVCLYWSIQTQT